MFIWIFVVALLFMLYMKSGVPGEKIKKLIQRSASLALQAQQDTAPIQAVVHANYAAAYLNAAKDIASSSEINRATGTNLKQFEEHILNVQESVTKKVLEKVPEFAGNVDLYLHSIARPEIDWAKRK